ncbi:Crp/Fnr family transcriptional regulator [Daejeonella oryzae]|uniref:Crp/Fnr family transcriptional regulator n=1 Tax=Daejeonella oryzae TaxID=1122943 RepID=UPI00040390EF|nr:Crp/Fnr family transcriptional regulator [Daejeonella oryzae]
MIEIDRLLAWGATYKKLSANETIFSEGQSCSYYYQLVSGNVRWVNIDEDGKECIHSIVEQGESFGELPLFDDGPYAATAISDTKSVVIRLYKPIFLDLIKENYEIQFAFTRLLAKRVRFKLSIIKSFGSHCPETRIANLLNYLKSENKNFCNDCNQLKLTRQQIADMTGLRVETVIRTMRHMHDKGELTIAKGKVFFTDMIEVILI